jgi:ribonuclease D
MIDTPEKLHTLIERALTAEHVAIDTEFVWERTYYPRLGVVQLGFSEEETFLIDAAALDDLTPLGRVLAAPEIVKILHDAEQDLTILRRATGASPVNVFDTQRAAGFVGLSATLSLGDLFDETLGLSLPKTESRTNWLQRPLTDQQYDYAHNDVRYLPAARDELLARARDRNREAWVHEEMAAYDHAERYEEKDPYTQYERIGGRGRMSPRQRAVLRELAAWREEEAQQSDRPRGHVLADKVLSGIARRIPHSDDQLASIRGLNDYAVRRYGTALLDAVERGLALPSEDCPPPPERPPDDDVLTAQVYFLLAYLTGKSLAHAIDPGMIAARADLVAFVAEGCDADPERHALLRGWRRTFMGNDLCALLDGRHAVRLDPDTGLAKMAS